jgi:hypothetical protein
MEKKQTAVEWLMEQRLQGANLDIALEQAKQMEKEQIKDAYKEGNHSEMRGGKVIFEKMEQYYNETYGGQEE